MKKPTLKDYKNALELLSDIIVKHKRKLPKEMLEDLDKLKDFE